jgi:putative ABC transport system permease protein
MSSPRKSKLKQFTQSLSIGFFLALREVRRANKWTTALIVTVMVLTFLNLIVISGILVGLIQSSINAVRNRYTGDVIVSTLLKKTYIEHSSEIVNILQSTPGVLALTARYTDHAIIEANYKNRTRLSDNVDQAGGIIAGINPLDEDHVGNLSHYLLEGRYLDPSDTDSIMIGANLLAKYSPIETPGLQTLKNVETGSKVRLIVGGETREVTVIGVVKSKVGEIDQRIFMVDRELRKMIGRTSLNVNEIAVKLDDKTAPESVKAVLVGSGFDQFAKIQTYVEARPKFLEDITATFAILGNLIGSIGLAVACITIFIIIFVNAITRRRFIGILKGIGIRSDAIEISYIIQAVFYAVLGVAIGSLIVFLFLKPFIDAHPINFPFSDGILVATPIGTSVRALILLVATLIAGYIPARLVVKQNTLDAILGR